LSRLIQVRRITLTTSLFQTSLCYC